MTSNELPAALQKELKSEARRLRLSAGAGWLGDATSDLFVYLHFRLDKKLDAEGRLPMRWSMLAKPMIIDSMAWATMSPDSSMGGAIKRIGLRSNGAFAVPGLRIDGGVSYFSPPESAAEWARDVVEQFRERAVELQSTTPDATAFLGVIDRARSTRPDLPSWHNLLRTFTILASGDADEAGRLSHAAVAAHEGVFVVGDTTIWQMLARDYDASAGVFAPGYSPKLP